jgi:outer membrane protein
MALQQNLSLVSSRLAADIARENVSSARGGHLPTLDLVAAATRPPATATDTNADGTPYGSTSLDQYQRIIGLQLTFPLYSGGMVSSQVRQAVYQHRAAKERWSASRARPSTMRAMPISACYRRFRASSAAPRGRIECDGAQAPPRPATRPARAPRSMCCNRASSGIQAQTDYSRSRYDYMMNVLKLQQAAGILSEQSLDRLNTCSRTRLRRPPATAQ